MKSIEKFVALDLRYLEKENSGLARYTINISKYLINENENNKLRFIIHGIEVSPFDNLIKACDILPHADNFLYLIIIDNVV